MRFDWFLLDFMRLTFWDNWNSNSHLSCFKMYFLYLEKIQPNITNSLLPWVFIIFGQLNYGYFLLSLLVDVPIEDTLLWANDWGCILERLLFINMTRREVITTLGQCVTTCLIKLSQFFFNFDLNYYIIVLRKNLKEKKNRKNVKEYLIFLNNLKLLFLRGKKGIF